MSLWLPASEQARVQADRQEYLSGLLAQAQLGETISKWNAILKKIDHRLEVVKAPDNVQHPALRPGFWHVIRHEGAEMPPAVLVHEGPNGEYRDLDSSLLERLRKGDMWSERSMKAQKDRQKAAARAAEKQEEQERADRVEHVMDLYKYKHTTKIAVP